MELYRMAPDFREDLTRYQVEHITGGSGTEYTSPSCKTMTTYGNCYGKDKFCEYVSHPLTYYRRTASRQNVKK
jgi:DNA primase large subunit